ncbi:hypothetical protein GGI05_004736 [Coemansia sp. RSA 2603]|nr:hypothetical protein GGI05_004736 [Coemansia sp. RSA 2603]
MFAARNLLANALAAEVDIAVPDQLTLAALWKTPQHIRINTGHTQTWHLAIPLRQIPSIEIPSAKHGRKLAHNLKQRTLNYTSSIDYCVKTGQLLATLTARALCDLSQAISEGLSRSYPVSGTLTPAVRIHKWTDSAGSSRNGLIADTLSRALFKLTQITPGGRTPVCPEIVRDHRDAPADTRCTSVQAVAARCLPRMFAALAAVGRMMHDEREGSLRTHVLLETGSPVSVADEQGCISQVAKDACVLFELMCAKDVVHGEMWCHFVPDSSEQDSAHWLQVVRVAQLAYESTMQKPVPFVNQLCFARKCSDLPKVSGAASEFAHKCLILGTYPTTSCPAFTRANGHYILNVYRRLSQLQKNPFNNGASNESLPPAATQVAVLVSALPETLYRAIAQQRTTLLVDYFTRLAHAAAKCLAGAESRNCMVLADACVVLEVGTRIIDPGCPT